MSLSNANTKYDGKTDYNDKTHEVSDEENVRTNIDDFILFESNGGWDDALEYYSENIANEIYMALIMLGKALLG